MKLFSLGSLFLFSFDLCTFSNTDQVFNDYITIAGFLSLSLSLFLSFSLPPFLLLSLSFFLARFIYRSLLPLSLALSPFLSLSLGLFSRLLVEISHVEIYSKKKNFLKLSKLPKEEIVFS